MTNANMVVYQYEDLPDNPHTELVYDDYDSHVLNLDGNLQHYVLDPSFKGVKVSGRKERIKSVEISDTPKGLYMYHKGEQHVRGGIEIIIGVEGMTELALRVKSGARVSCVGTLVNEELTINFSDHTEIELKYEGSVLSVDGEDNGSLTLSGKAGAASLMMEDHSKLSGEGLEVDSLSVEMSDSSMAALSYAAYTKGEVEDHASLSFEKKTETGEIKENDNASVR